MFKTTASKGFFGLVAFVFFFASFAASAQKDTQKVGICADPKSDQDKVVCANALEIQAQEAIKKAQKLKVSVALPSEKKAMKVDKAIIADQKQRLEVISMSGLSNCPVVENTYPPAMLLKEGILVEVPGWTLQDGQLFVVSDSGVLIDPSAVGNASWQAYGTLMSKNINTVSINIVDDRGRSDRAGRVVVKNLCAGGRITLFQEIQPFSRGGSNTKIVSWSAEGTFPDGSMGVADSGTLFLDQRQTSQRNGEYIKWYIELRKIPQQR